MSEFKEESPRIDLLGEVGLKGAVKCGNSKSPTGTAGLNMSVISMSSLREAPTSYWYCRFKHVCDQHVFTYIQIAWMYTRKGQTLYYTCGIIDNHLHV